MNNDDAILSSVDLTFRPLPLEGDLQMLADSTSRWASAGLTVRVVRGRKMRDLPALFDEFSAALQFPGYFGENEDAFDECIAELDIPTTLGYVITITEPDELLMEDQERLRWLTGSLSNAARLWSRPGEQEDVQDRDPVPFHVVLVGDPDVLRVARRRWSQAGTEWGSFDE